MSAVLAFNERTDAGASFSNRHRRFSLKEYERMIEVGILTEQDSCELIRGKILEKNWEGGSAYPPYHRFSLDQYEQMIADGILTEQDRCELIRGEIVEKMTIGEPHAACVTRLAHCFYALTQEVAIVSVQNHVVLDNSRPEPDLALLLPRDDFYSEAAPHAADILLLIEVADSSLTVDRTTKLSLYAQSGVGEYWIVNLIDRCVEVYRDPQHDGTYSDMRVLHSGETLGILALAGVTLAVDQVFPVRRDR